VHLSLVKHTEQPQYRNHTNIILTDLSLFKMFSLLEKLSMRCFALTKPMLKALSALRSLQSFEYESSHRYSSDDLLKTLFGVLPETLVNLKLLIVVEFIGTVFCQVLFCVFDGRNPS
jgi:hypothetical protein